MSMSRRHSMATGRAPRWALVSILTLSISAARTFSDASATEEIFRVLPNDIGACLVIEDVAHYYELGSQSKLAERLEGLESFQNWKSSPTYKSFEVLVASLPAYFGISNSDLIRDIFGQSVVLAFRPPTPAQPPTGIVLCRAAREEILKKVVDWICAPTPFRQVSQHRHRNVPFVERVEFGARHDFVVRLGSVVAISDKRDAIEKVIDVSLDGGSLSEETEFRNMRAAVGEGAVVQLLLSTRALKTLLERAVTESGSAGHVVSALLANAWSALDWAAVSLRIGDPIELSLYASIDPNRLDESFRIWPDLFAQRLEFWERVPAEAMAAAATQMDFRALASWLCSLADDVPELREGLEAVAGLVGGLNVDELLARMGPEVGAVALVASTGDMQVVAEVELLSEDAPTLAGLPLPQAIELVALRPMLLLYSLDHNRQFDDVTRVTTQQVGTLRLHSLVGSRCLPPWLEPTVAVSDQRMYFASSPEAILARQSTPAESFPQSAAARRIRHALGEDAVLKGFLNVAKLRAYTASHQKELASRIAEQIPNEEGAVSQKIDDVSSILSFVDYLTLSTSTSGNVRKWTLAAFPAP